MEELAEKKAERICKAITLCISLFLFSAFFANWFQYQTYNFSLLLFSLFLFFGVLGNGDKSAVYERMDFSVSKVLEKGAEIKRVAILETRRVKDVLKFLSKGNYLVLEIYDEQERHLFDLPQNEFSQLFLLADSPYETLRDLRKKHRFL